MGGWPEFLRKLVAGDPHPTQSQIFFPSNAVFRYPKTNGGPSTAPKRAVPRFEGHSNLRPRKLKLSLDRAPCPLRDVLVRRAQLTFGPFAAAGIFFAEGVSRHDRAAV